MNSRNPDISVVIPVHNGESYLSMCLHALKASFHTEFETIVVDDGSRDGSAAMAKDFGVKVLELGRNYGPAAARNEGAAAAAAPIVLFIDADVLVRGDTITRILDAFSGNPDITAVFGSYDTEPSAPDFLSQYRNLLHHYVHQKSRGNASTFWSGCGAVRKDVFMEMGGFDRVRFSKPSIEDIELGYRMKRKGHRILLDKELQVKHLKEWSFWSMLRTDVSRRAVPWSKLMLESGFSPRDMNVSTADRVSAALVGILSVAVLVTVFAALFGSPDVLYPALILSAVLVISLIVLNRRLYVFFLEERGLGFTLMAIPMHFLYFFYSGVSYGLCWLGKKLSKRK
ncbi:MAG: glycosyltransferase [Candidatus Dadabacteria bacterium]|nr:glycosyltransferase [Candidatus Dadabacteria bacterium]